jgi:hypothetical protein
MGGRDKRLHCVLDWAYAGDLGMRFCEAYELVYHRGSGKTVEVIRAQADIQAADSLNRIADNQVVLRDHFAGLAMQGICAHAETWGMAVPQIASQAYKMADAMLKARSE